MTEIKSITWNSPEWGVECAGFVEFYDGWNWTLVEELIFGDHVWVHRDSIVMSEGCV